MKRDLIVMLGYLLCSVVAAAIGVASRDWLMTAYGWPILWSAAAATVLATLGGVGVVATLGALARWAGRNC